MNKTKFWRLIAAAKAESGGDLESQMQILEESLADLKGEEIIQFQKILDELISSAHRWDLRGAAHVISGGCSDDSFYYFRGWLVAQGQKIFEEALDDPDSLSAVAEPEVECEDILNVAAQAYEEKTGEEMPRNEIEVAEPAGEEWIEEDLPDLFPRLWAKFGEEEEEEA